MLNHKNKYNFYTFWLIIPFNIQLILCQIPQPIMTLHEGYIDLNDRLLETEFNGVYRRGRPYTLDIYMGNTEEYDYIINQCNYGQNNLFIDHYGCSFLFLYFY